MSFMYYYYYYFLLVVLIVRKLAFTFEFSFSGMNYVDANYYDIKNSPSLFSKIKNKYSIILSLFISSEKSFSLFLAFIHFIYYIYIVI